MKTKLFLLSLLLALSGCSTTTTTSSNGDKVVVHKLDPEAIAAINAAVIDALNQPAVVNALSNATAPKK